MAVIIHRDSKPTKDDTFSFQRKYKVTLKDKNGEGTRSKVVQVQGHKLEERDALREAEAQNPGWGAKKVTLDQSAEQETGELEKQMKAMTKDCGCEATRDAEEKSEGGKYNATAVNKEIAKDPRIKGKEAKLIHRLLKGRTSDESNMTGEASYTVVLTLENGKVITERGVKAESGVGAESKVRVSHGRPKARAKVTQDEMFPPYESELQKSTKLAQGRADAEAAKPKPRGKQIHIWFG